MLFTQLSNPFHVTLGHVASSGRTRARGFARYLPYAAGTAIFGYTALFVLVPLGAATAQAATPIAGTAGIDLTQIIVALINLVFPAVAAVATYLINGHIKNQQLAAQLSNAVQNAVGVVQQNALDSLQGKTVLKLGTGDPAFDKGIQYVLDNAREALTHFNIPNDRIAEKIEAKIGLAAVETNRAATQSSSTSVNGPLAPVPATVGRLV